MILRLGITGGIAAGKSTAARIAAKHLGGVVINADTVGHELLSLKTDVGKSVVKHFGSAVVSHDGETIDRDALARIAFASEKNLAVLEACTHPSIVSHVQEKFKAIEKDSPDKLIVLEAVKLLQTGLVDLVDSVIVVETTPELQVARLRERGYSEDDIALRMRATALSFSHPKVQAVIRNTDSHSSFATEVQYAMEQVSQSLPISPTMHSS